MTTADAPPAGTESLESLVRQRLAGRAHVRGLRVVVRDQGIFLEGRATCYYAKQLARHVAMAVTGPPLRANRIEVCSAAGGR
jgi:hypothetical protein